MKTHYLQPQSRAKPSEPGQIDQQSRVIFWIFERGESQITLNQKFLRFNHEVDFGPEQPQIKCSNIRKCLVCIHEQTRFRGQLEIIIDLPIGFPINNIISQVPRPSLFIQTPWILNSAELLICSCAQGYVINVMLLEWILKILHCRVKVCCSCISSRCSVQHLACNTDLQKKFPS